MRASQSSSVAQTSIIIDKYVNNNLDMNKVSINGMRILGKINCRLDYLEFQI